MTGIHDLRGASLPVRLRRAGAGVVSLAAILGAAFLAGSAPAAQASVSPPIYTIAGTGVQGDSGNGGPAIQALMDRPRNIEPLPDGSYLFAQPFENDVRRIWPDGTITLFAGTGVAGSSGDGGPATQAQLNFPHATSMLPSGAVLIADNMNSKIREVLPDGTIKTVAGTGVGGYSGDGGPATSAKINAPRAVSALPDGGFLIPDGNNHCIRRVSPTGTITRVAGICTSQGFSGDGGQALSAQLNTPFGVSPLPDGGFLIDDVGNQRVRRVWPDGTITTVAGNGIAGYTGDGGPATDAELNNPHNVWATADGGFFIADASNSAIRKVSSTGIITTVAGTGTPGFSGDGGPATSAQLGFPKAIAELPSGAWVIADNTNNRIRYVGDAVAPAAIAPPGITGAPQQGQTLLASTGSWSATPPASYAYQWQRCDSSGASCVDIPGATVSSYLVTVGDVGSTLRVTVTATNPAGSLSQTSGATAAVSGAPSAPVNTSPPSISGTPTDGQTLTASPGSWSGTQPITYAYQWQRCDGSGASCAPIASATSTTYVVQSSDVGSTFRIQVAASNSATAAAYSNAVSGDAPRSYWRFDETSGALVDQRGFKNGTYVGSPQRGVPGLLAADPDTAVSLDGASQYLSVPADAAWTPSTFSIEVLVQASSLPLNKTIWSTIGSGCCTGWWLNTGPSGEIRFFIGNGSAWKFTDTTTILNAGTRFHVVGTYDGTNTRLYVNGSLVATGPSAGMNGNVGSSPMTFGSFSSGPGQYWPGVIDDASFSPAVLSSSQASAHYQAATTSAPNASSAATAPAGAAAPANSTAPSVSGTAQVGQALTASTGTWTGTQPITYAYQWQKASALAGPNSYDTGATSSTYTPVAGDANAYVRVTVTATNGGGSTPASSSAVGPVAAAPAAPSNTAAPSVSGTAQVGQTLTADPGTWTGTQPITYAYKWQKASALAGPYSDISGATSPTYGPVAGDVGAYLRVVVTATNSVGSTPANSSGVGPVAAAPTPPSNTAAPSISGTAQVGQTLTASTGTWTGTPPITYAYQWQKGSAAAGPFSDIAGATSSTYVPVSGDATAYVRVTVTATNGVGSTPASSSAVGPVAAATKATITLTKSLAPATDPGRFNLVVGSTTVKASAGNGDSGSTQVVAGTYTIKETAAAGTSLSDYGSSIACTLNGGTGPSANKTSLSVTVAAGDVLSCTFTNQRKAIVTLSKSLAPAGDSGRFDLKAGSTVIAANVGNGGTGTAGIAPGTFSLKEVATAGTGTTLSNYTTTISCTLNGAAGPSGTGTTLSVTVAPGDALNCTFTNTRKATVTLTKALVPTTDTGRFDLRVGSTTVKSSAGNGDSGTGTAAPGSVTIKEVATSGTGTNLANYTTTISCTLNGGAGPSGNGTSLTVTLAAADVLSCTFTNTHK